MPRREHIGGLVIAAGRQWYLTLSLLSLSWQLDRVLDHVVLVDASQDGLPSTTRQRAGRLARTLHVADAPGADLETAMLTGLERLAELDVEFVVHCEEDFVFLRRLDLDLLTQLAAQADSCQALLSRQRWYRDEFASRTFADYLERRYGTDRSTAECDDPALLRLHGLFSLNPSVYRLEQAQELVDLAARTDRDDPFEPKLFEAAQSLGRAAVVRRHPGRPDVWHLGAVSTTRHRQLAARGDVSKAGGYMRAHLSRGRAAVMRTLRVTRW